MAKKQSTKQVKNPKPKVAKEEPKVNLQMLREDELLGGDILPNHYNPNVQQPRDFELLLASIAEEGFNQRVVVVELTENHLNADPKMREYYKRGDIVIVDGEHRWRAWGVLNYLVQEDLWNKGKPDEDLVLQAREGVGEIYKGKLVDLKVPVVFVDLTPEQMKVATLRRNRARGNEDQDLLSSLFKELDVVGALDWAGKTLKMSENEVQSLVKSATEVLAGDSFSEAWEPRPDTENGEPPNSFDPGNQGGDNGPTSEQEEKYPSDPKKKPRKVESESSDAKKAIDTGKNKHQLFTLHLVFFGSEADLVRAVLAKDAANQVVEWCKERSELVDSNAGRTPSEISSDA